MAKQIALCLSIIFIQTIIVAQQRVGINTTSPVRTLEVYGTLDQHIRVHSSSGFSGLAGMEFLRGTNDFNSPDWRFTNDGGVLRLHTSDDNFSTGSNEVMRINSEQNTGIGSSSPQARLHIDGGAPIIFGGAGYLKIGANNSYNLAMDYNQIIALNNGAPAPLYFQANGGNTNIGLTGGNIYMGLGGGGLGIGTTTIDAPLSIAHDNFQLCIDNDGADANNWHIGVTNNNWQAGDDQLIFSPTSSSGDAVLRLKNVSENDGINAPVMIYTTEDQTILLDGNEIDTRGTPLYINHNSDEETYINPSGGMVGIGTTNPQAMLHVFADAGNILSLQRDNALWHINPDVYGDENLGFYWDDVNGPYAQVNGETGQWTYLSDRNFKENITPLEEVLTRLKQLGLYTYTFKHDEKHQERIGVIAQEVESLFPEMVKVNEGQYGMSYTQLAVVGLKAIQEQQELIESLKEKIQQLKKKIQVENQPVTHNVTD